MASTFMRRSGIAVGLIAELIEWVPDSIYQVGIGTYYQETKVFFDAWPNVKLIGYEANPSCYKIAKENPKDPYPGDLRLKALGDKVVNRLPIYEKHRHKDGSSIFPFDEDVKVVQYTTSMSTLDHEFPNGPEGKHVMLWLDCEGCESMVLDGGKKFIENVEIINAEMTANPICKEWCSAIELHEKLLGLGFKRQWNHTQRSSAGQVDAIYVRPHLFMAEFCCCPCQCTPADIEAMNARCKGQKS